MKRACWLAWRGWNRCRRIDIQFASALDGRIALVGPFQGDFLSVSSYQCTFG
jgi:hypothetical protein